MNGTRLAEIIEAEASTARNKGGQDLDGYAMELLGNAIYIPNSSEISFTSDGYLIEGKDREHQEREILAANADDSENYSDAELFINDAVWVYMNSRPVFF